MTWSHYNAHLEDANGRKAYACIECDKHSPKIITAKLAYFITEGCDAGCVGWPVMSHDAHNTPEGEKRLVIRIQAYAAEHGLKFTAEEFTEFSNTKPK